MPFKPMYKAHLSGLSIMEKIEGEFPSLPYGYLQNF